MIKRVAMWKLKPECNQDDVIAMGKMLESLVDRIEALTSVEVGINVSTSDSRCDIVFIGTFPDADALRLFTRNAWRVLA